MIVLLVVDDDLSALLLGALGTLAAPRSLSGQRLQPWHQHCAVVLNLFGLELGEKGIDTNTR